MSFKCISSQWCIHVARDSYVYIYDVDIKFGPREKLNKNYQRSSADVKLLSKSKCSNFKDLCRHIVDGLDELYGYTVVYNDRAVLLSNKPLQNDIDLIWPQCDLDNFLKKFLTDEQAVLHILITHSKTIKLSEFPIDAAATFSEDRSWRSAVEMILSEFPVTRDLNQYFSMGPGELCEKKSTPFECGLFYRDGHQKGVEVIESKNGPQLGVSLDFRRKIFFPEMNFLDLVKKFLRFGISYAECETLFQHIKLCPNYNRGRILTFKKFSERKVRDLRCEENSLEAFYQSWNIQLKFLDEPAANMFNGRGDFPLELLEILPNQTVRKERIPKTNRLQNRATDLNRIDAQARFIHIRRQFEKLSFNNQISTAFGLRVDLKMLEGSFVRLPQIRVILHGGISKLTNDLGTFAYDRNKYFKSSGFTEIVVFAADSHNQKSMECANKLVEEAKKKGMNMPKPIFKRFNTFSESLKEWMDALKELKGIKPLALIVDSNHESHPIIKLAQALTGIQTQHLFFETASKVAKGRPQTLENIVHKLNLKGGGLNHLVEWGSELKKINPAEMMILAWDVCHPTGADSEGDEPSTVGLVSNYFKDPNEFAGLFFFQSTRKESIDESSLQIHLTKMLQKAQNHRTIKTIFVIRDGIGETQYAEFRDTELATLERTAKQLSIDAKIVAVIATKDGITRHFMDTSRGKVDSMPPRSIISFGCRYGFKQFYMIAHKSSIGTCKPVMVTVIRDDLGLSTSELQTFLLGLSQMHQIISAPVSLPAPLFQADVLAEHGQNLYYALKKYSEGSIPTNLEGGIDFMQLSNLLNFNSGSLPETRYTA